jgi:hypothetical protein
MVNFKVGDLIADKDVFGDTIDIALVLETPEKTKGHYTIYYCTGPISGDIVLETRHAMSPFRLLSAGGGRADIAKRESKIFFPDNKQPRGQKSMNTKTEEKRNEK